MDLKIFEEMGFTKGEIAVYFALLQYGESTIGPLSKQSKVTAAKVYPILEKLKEKGLITYVIKSGTKYYQALNPNRLIDYLTEKENKIEQEKQQIKKLLPSLQAHQRHTEQYATIYEGYNGIKTLYQEILQQLSQRKEPFLAFTLGDEYQSEQANLFFQNYDAKRAELRIPIKLLALESQRSYFDKKYNQQYRKSRRLEYRFLSQSLPTGVIIYGNNVATLLWNQNPIAFVIHSEQNAKVYKKFFNDLWTQAKP